MFSYCYYLDTIRYTHIHTRARIWLLWLLENSHRHAEFPSQKTVKIASRLTTFLTNSQDTVYYRRFMKKFSALAKPLTELTKKETIFDWTTDCQKAFYTLKQKLCEAPLLRYPDYSKEFLLITDESNRGLGAVLSQDGHSCCYISHTLNSAKPNYSTSDKDLLAIVWATKLLRQHLLGRHFKIQTDHQALVWLHNVKDPLSLFLRWRLRL